MHIKHIHDTIEKLSQYACEEACKNKESINTEELGEVVDMIRDLACAEKDARISKAMEEADKEEEEEIKYIIKKMKEEGKDWGEDEARRFYRGQTRSKTSGRYMSRGDSRRNRGYEEPMYYGMMPEIYNPMEYYRDLDRDNMGRMYYSSGGTGGNSVGQSGQSNGMRSNMGGNTRGYEEGYSEGNRRGYEEGYRQGSQNGRRSSNYDNARRGYSEGKQEHKGNTPEDNIENMRNLEKLLGVVGGDIRELKPGMSQQEKAMTAQKLEAWARELKQA